MRVTDEMVVLAIVSFMGGAATKDEIAGLMERMTKTLYLVAKWHNENVDE